MRVLQICPLLNPAAAAVATLILLSVSPLHAQEAAPPAAGPQTAATSTSAPAAENDAKKMQPSSKSLATWRGKVIAHLNTAKRDFGAADGTATVAFKIDRSGKVTSARVLASSGNKALDQEAVSLTERASPVPAPPADVAGETLYFEGADPL